MSDTKNDINAQHKKILLEFIKNEKAPSKSFNDYICLLSLFLSSGNRDYNYTYTYLKEKNKDLINFLQTVKYKKGKLIEVNKIVRDIFVKQNYDHKNIFIYIDDFFVINCNGEVKIVDDFSIQKANRNIRYSSITILDKFQKNKVITLLISDIKKSKIENLIKIVFLEEGDSNGK